MAAPPVTPDGHHLIDDVVAADEVVVTRCRFVGTHQSRFADLEPTGRTVTAGVIHIDRFRDGRLAEHHGQLDMLGLLQQISAA